MARNANVLTIRLPRDLKNRIQKVADEQGVSMNQFAIYAFTREICELETTSFFQAQYAGKTKKEIFDEFDAVIKKIPRKSPPAWDQIES